MIKIILFDLGGVLVELTGVPTMHQWTQNRYDEATLWEAWLSSPAVRAFEKGHSTAKKFGEQLIREMDLPIETDEFIQAFTRWPKGLFPGVPHLMERLRKDYTLACLSNSNVLHWPLLMNDMGLETMFDHCFGSHLMHKVKPDREAFEYVLNRLDCNAASVLFLDDNDINVNSARDMGMTAHRVKGPKDIEQVFHKTGMLISNEPDTRVRGVLAP
jgi:glucose-1-phosphatase